MAKSYDHLSTSLLFSHTDHVAPCSCHISNEERLLVQKLVAIRHNTVNGIVYLFLYTTSCSMLYAQLKRIEKLNTERDIL